MTSPSSSPQAHTWQTRLAAADPTLHVHLIGIGGAGLSAIATVLLEMGVAVSGSDRQANSSTARLAEAGARVFDQQDAANLTEIRPDVVLISSAIDAANPERAAAEAAELAVVKRDEFLPALLAERELIAVAGTHGKSTTTSMIVKVLRENGIDAGYIIGTELPGYGNAAAGTLPILSSKRTNTTTCFLGLQPAIAVVTNVEWDHPDCYPDAGQLSPCLHAICRQRRSRRADHLLRRRSRGRAVACLQLQRVGRSGSPTALSDGADLPADQPDAAARAQAMRLILLWWNAPAGSTGHWSVPGSHNLHNAMAALLVGRSCGVGLPAGALQPGTIPRHGPAL